MIAVELFFALVVAGSVVVLVLQHRIRKEPRGHKGDAVKSAEEVRTHTRSKE
jgi:hypothetical protein